MKKILLITILLGSLVFMACEKILLKPIEPNTAVGNFESLWKNFDRMYGQFLVRNVKWDSLYTVYRPQLDEQSNTDDLYRVLKALITNLHDDHVFIDPTEPGYRRIESGRSDTMKVQTDFSIDVVKQHYLQSYTRYADHLLYGKLDGNIGYIQMDIFMDPVPYIEKGFDEAFDALKDTRGIVFDIRRLDGGEDRLAKYIAGRFSAEKKLYMISKRRNGPDHGDFEAPVNWYVEPTGNSQYLKPIVLLTGRFTASAGETFTWAMNELPQVTQVGDTTLGAFADVMSMELPNGWIYTIAIGDYRNASGQNLEGIGIAPKYAAKSTREETKAGIDKGLEQALELLK